MVGVQFTPRQRAFMVLRFAETHSAVQVQQEFRRRFGRAPPTPVTIRNDFKKYRDEGTSQNLCKQRSGRPNLRTIKALWRGVNCTPTMMSSKLINEDPCSNHGLLDGVGNIINNVYSLKHVKHDKDEFIK